MRFRITPRDNTFFALFTALAEHLVTGADLLSQLIEADPADRAELAKQLKDTEHAADSSTHSIFKRVNQTFVTPFDRDDIYNLATSLDDCIDHMDAAGEIIVLYGVDELPEGVRDQVATLQQAATLTAEAMPKLATMDELEGYWIEVNRLENEADRSYRSLVADLFRNPRYQATPAGVVELMRIRTVVDTLEMAADSFETVANTVETIVLKES